MLILCDLFSVICFWFFFLNIRFWCILWISTFLLVLWYLICLASLWFQSRLEEVYTVIILFLCGLVNMLYHWMFLYIYFLTIFSNFEMYSRGIAQFYTLCDSFLFFILGFQFLLVLWRTFSSFKKCSYYYQHIVYDHRDINFQKVIVVMPLLW